MTKQQLNDQYYNTFSKLSDQELTDIEDIITEIITNRNEISWDERMARLNKTK